MQWQHGGSELKLNTLVTRLHLPDFVTRRVFAWLNPLDVFLVSSTSSYNGFIGCVCVKCRVLQYVLLLEDLNCHKGYLIPGMLPAADVCSSALYWWFVVWVLRRSGWNPCHACHAGWLETIPEIGCGRQIIEDERSIIQVGWIHWFGAKCRVNVPV